MSVEERYVNALKMQESGWIEEVRNIDKRIAECPS